MNVPLQIRNSQLVTASRRFGRLLGHPGGHEPRPCTAQPCTPRPRTPWSRTPWLLLACAAPLALLAGCGPEDQNAFAPACAPVGILGQAADYSDYGGSEAQPDLSRLGSQGSIVGVAGHCSSAANGTMLHTAIGMQLAITRGPVAPGSSITVPYFIAVTQDGAIISKQNLTALAQFPDNGDRVLVRTDQIAFDLPVTRAHPGTSYKIDVGFQLTPQQLDYNRNHPPR